MEAKEVGLRVCCQVIEERPMHATIDGVRVFCEFVGGEDPYGRAWLQSC
jgi:hypothetical protein